MFDHQPDGPRHRRAGGSLAGKFAGDRIAAASLYALHHGLAKGALFMHLGVVAVCGARSLVPVLAVLSLPALSLAGLPLTGGALAKLAAKPPLGGGMPELLFTLSAIGTSLLMLRFMLKVAES